MEQNPSWEANSHIIKKFPTFYGTQRFIIVFTRARHWSSFWARWIQSIHSHPTSPRSVLILLSHLCLFLPSGLFHSGFPTKILYSFFISPMHATFTAHLILLGFITLINIRWSVQVMKLLILQSSPVFFPLRYKYSQHPVLKHPQSVFFP